MENVFYTVLCILAINLIDGIIYHKGIIHDNHRWCVIHVIVNLTVVFLTTRGLITLLSSDLHQINISESKPEHSGFTIWSSIVVMAAHLHHLINYEITDMSLMAHHVLMMSVLTIPYFNSNNAMFLFFTDYTLFFMCGLPGMIDYYCMHLCYSNRMDRICEKKINNFLNAYIRAPGILYGVYYTYRLWVNGRLVWYYASPVILTFIWNAQFFSNSVAISYGFSLAGKKIE